MNGSRKYLCELDHRSRAKRGCGEWRAQSTHGWAAVARRRVGGFSTGRRRGRGFSLAATLPRVAVHDWLLVRLCGSSQTRGSEEKSGRET